MMGQADANVNVHQGEDVETALGLGLGGHQPNDKAEAACGASDGDDDRLENGGDGHIDIDMDATDEDASASDSASHGTTATSSGDSAYRHDKSLASTVCCDKANAKSCCFRWGCFVAFWLLVAGTIVVGKEVVELASQREAEQMEEEFFDLASELVLNSQHRHQAVLDSLQTMSLTATTLSASMGQTFPFVTLPDFDRWTNRFSIGAKAITLVVLAEEDQREAWNNFSQTNVSAWVGDMSTGSGSIGSTEMVPHAWKYRQEEGDTEGIDFAPVMPAVAITRDEQIMDDKWVGVAAISWQSTSPIDMQSINFNQLSSPALKPAIDRLEATQLPIQWSTPAMPSVTFMLQPILAPAPIDNSDPNAVQELMGYLMAQINWISYLQGVGGLADTDFVDSVLSTTSGLVLIVQDICEGHAVEVDFHEMEAVLIDSDRVLELLSTSAMTHEAPLGPSRNNQEDDSCASPILIRVFATDSFAGVTKGADSMQTQPPKLAIETGIFVVLLGMICFLLYHFWTQRQQAELAKSAQKTLAIVNSLFPANVRDRLLEKEDTISLPHARSVVGLKRASTCGKKVSNNKIGNRVSMVFQSMAESMALAHDSTADDPSDCGTPLHVSKSFSSSLRRRMASKPIADLFPQVTVLFADIAGFTSWSSVREPSQVFTLLESIFEVFDGIAKRHNVFKVETIGDCYVCATGLPDPKPDHAIVMSIFARKALHRMGSVVHALDTYLGPGTSELSMRIGIHSGPIMAGVLRGEKTRFQLFGDTMNTAARIESSGEKNRIHLSKQTADLLILAGKESWVQARDVMITAKGKGQLQTYWLTLSTKSSNTISSSTASHTTAPSSKPGSGSELLMTMPSMRRRMTVPHGNTVELETVSGATTPKSVSCPSKSDQMKRLVDYNTQVLERYLKKMVAMRQGKTGYAPSASSTNDDTNETALVPAGISSGGTIFDEVQESIALPTEPARYLQDPDQVVLSSSVTKQLREFVGAIASLYRDVPFHSFDHASHVLMSVTKLMARVVTPETIDYKEMSYKSKAASSELHQYTYGITSDPLTQFAVALSALVHDVDHFGVPNAQLVKEKHEIAITYSNKSVAEQNSLDLAWGLLTEDSFNDLRACIYTSQAELDRFRALLVNMVLATDIADKDLSALRRRRWEKVFGTEDCQSATDTEDQESTNRKATIVIEHLIQASDVAHTMQHWHVYLRWNKRLFKECYLAYQSGRSDKDPLESWYQGELGFFDFYIIPLAKKLKECGVFGVASDEYLQYAVANRTEWEVKGRDVVEEYRSDVLASAQAEAS